MLSSSGVFFRQIQLILYETHSALEAENQAQVTRAIAEANRLARERYALLKKKHRQTVSVSILTPEIFFYYYFRFSGYLLCFQSPQKHASGADPAVTESSAVIENTTRSDIDKDDRTEDSVSNPSPKQPPSTNRSRPQSADISIRKPTDNDTIVSRPGFNKARPIPAMPEPGTKAIPKDPDHDNPNIYVSTYSSYYSRCQITWR